MTPMSTEYWYDGTDPAVALLSAVRRFRRADQEMRRRLSSDMSLNATDVEAVRRIIARERAGDPLTARELTAGLHISTAATAKLLNRLTDSGHIIRRPHPGDRRSIIIVATGLAHDELGDWLAPMHEKMLQAARDVLPQHRQAVIDFLESLAEAFEPDAESDDRT